MLLDSKVVVLGWCVGEGKRGIEGEAGDITAWGREHNGEILKVNY